MVVMADYIYGLNSLKILFDIANHVKLINIIFNLRKERKMSEKQINYPKKKFRIRKISSAVFEKEDSKDGRPFTKKSICIQKSTKDQASGEWQNQTIFLLPHELPALITVAQQAYQHCELNEHAAE